MPGNVTLGLLDIYIAFVVVLSAACVIVYVNTIWDPREHFGIVKVGVCPIKERLNQIPTGAVYS